MATKGGFTDLLRPDAQRASWHDDKAVGLGHREGRQRRIQSGVDVGLETKVQLLIGVAPELSLCGESTDSWVYC